MRNFRFKSVVRYLDFSTREGHALDWHSFARILSIDCHVFCVWSEFWILLVSEATDQSWLFLCISDKPLRSQRWLHGLCSACSLFWWWLFVSRFLSHRREILHSYWNCILSPGYKEVIITATSYCIFVILTSLSSINDNVCFFSLIIAKTEKMIIKKTMAVIVIIKQRRREKRMKMILLII